MTYLHGNASHKLKFGTSNQLYIPTILQHFLCWKCAEQLRVDIRFEDLTCFDDSNRLLTQRPRGPRFFSLRSHAQKFAGHGPHWGALPRQLTIMGLVTPPCLSHGACKDYVAGVLWCLVPPSSMHWWSEISIWYKLTTIAILSVDFTNAKKCEFTSLCISCSLSLLT